MIIQLIKKNSFLYDKIINYRKNLGKGNAVKEGLKWPLEII